MSGKKPKRSSKNLKINTRIVLTAVLAIAIPLVLVALVCLGLLHSTSHTFQLAAETADRYSLVNQIGWNQTVSNLSRCVAAHQRYGRRKAGGYCRLRRTAGEAGRGAGNSTG